MTIQKKIQYIQGIIENVTVEGNSRFYFPVDKRPTILGDCIVSSVSISTIGDAISGRFLFNPQPCDLNITKYSSGIFYLDFDGEMKVESDCTNTFVWTDSIIESIYDAIYAIDNLYQWFENLVNIHTSINNSNELTWSEKINIQENKIVLGILTNGIAYQKDVKALGLMYELGEVAYTNKIEGDHKRLTEFLMSLDTDK